MTNYVFGKNKILYEGQFDGYTMLVYLNEEGYVITEFLNDDKSAAYSSMSYFAKVEGDAESFIETLPKDIIFIMTHSTNKNYKFIVISSTPKQFKLDPDEIKSFTKEKMEYLEKTYSVISKIGESYDIKFIPYSKMDTDSRKELLKNPLLMSQLTNLKSKVSIENTKKIERENKKITLGFYKNSGEISYEGVDEFKTTILVYGKFEKNKRQIIHLFSEEFSANDTNTIIFSDNKEYQNIRNPSEDYETLKNKTGLVPQGLPLSNMNIGDSGVKVDLELLPKGLLTQSYRVGINNQSKIIENIIEKGDAKDLKELYDKIGKFVPQSDITKYDISMAQRIVKIIDNLNKDAFSSIKTSVYEGGSKNMGKVNIIEMGLDNTLNKLVIYSVIKSLENKNILIVLPFSDKIFERDKDTLIEDEITKLITQNKKNKFLIATPTEQDIDEKIFKNNTSKISIVDETDVAISFANSKPYRLEIRPPQTKLE